MIVGRLIPLAAESAGRNMSIDQAILQSVDQGGAATLRFYSWAAPTLSMGYFQKLGDRALHAASKRLGVVRRSTGGGAIVHDRELTYSIAIPVAGQLLGAREDLYHSVHDAFIKALAEFGIRAARHVDVRGRLGCGDAFLCFRRRTDQDLVVSGYKILGSAQRRARGAVLQHGSLLLNASSFAPELPGVADLVPKEIEASEICHALISSLGDSLGIDFQPGGLTSPEIATANQVCRDRFQSTNWLNRR